MRKNATTDDPAERPELPEAFTVNRGGLPAQEVRVVGELASPGGEPVTAEFTIDILAGSESKVGTMIFSSDPTAYAFSVRVESFR